MKKCTANTINPKWKLFWSILWKYSEKYEVVEPLVLHVQGFLGFGGLILGVVTNDSIALRQVQMEGNERAVLHAQSP